MKLTEKRLLDKFHVGGSPIEKAHRTGRAVQNKPGPHHRSVLQPGNEDGSFAHGESKTEHDKGPDHRRPHPGRHTREKQCSPNYGRTLQTSTMTIISKW